VVGALTIWLGLTRRQEWIRAIGVAIATLAVYVLLLVQLQPAPEGYVTLLNGRAAAGVSAVLVAYGLAILHRRAGAHVRQLAAFVAVLITTASLLTLSFLTSEIDAFWGARGALGATSLSGEGFLSIAWAGVGGVLIWQGLSTRRAWMRAIGGVALAVAGVRLVVAQFADASPGYVMIANPRVVASVCVVAVLYGLARLYQTTSDVAESRYAPQAVLLLAANAVTVTLLTSEITAYWQLRDASHVSDSAAVSSHLAREMMVSITWALYATLLIVVGLKKHYAPIRYFAMTVFIVTIVKVFAIDLAELDRLYRVLSVIGLGIALLVTSYLYQRSRETGEPASR